MKRPKNENKILIIISICLILLIIILTCLFQIIIPNMKKDETYVSEDFVKNDDLSLDNIHMPSEGEWIKLQLSGEESRIHYYIATFIDRYIGYSKYELAYDALSEGFKKNYFDTYEKFVSYVEQKYPKSTILSYGDIQREGELYILEVTIEEVFSNEEPIKQTFVVKENDFNDFEIAFSV